MSGALEGVRVLDLTWYIAGPFCTKLLADYGAEVLKVERPPEGDPARRMGPFPGDIPHPERSGLFLHLNTNKRSITLNLKSATGRGILLQLARWADVVVESFRPGVMDSLGLSYNALSSQNPRLVMVSISNFGQDGPYRGLRADDIILYAMGGAMHHTGSPDREPTRLGLYVALYHGGALAALATVTALLQAEATGRGDHLDISLFEAHAGSQDRRTTMLLAYQHTGQVLPRRVPGSIIATGVKPCRDGYIGMMAGLERFPRVVQMLGRPKILQDPRFATVEARSSPENVQAFEEEHLLPWLLERSRREAWAEMQRHRILSGPVFTPAEVMEDPHFRERGVWARVEHPALGSVTIPGRPFVMSRTPWQVRRPAPLLGQHNQEVLCGMLGYSRADLVRLRQAGVI